LRFNLFAAMVFGDEAGVEHHAKTSGNLQGSAESGAESGALGGTFDPAMREAACAWSSLSPNAKRAMRGIIRVIDQLSDQTLAQ
jgi:hypothetical protein